MVFTPFLTLLDAGVDAGDGGHHAEDQVEGQKELAEAAVAGSVEDKAQRRDGDNANVETARHRQQRCWEGDYMRAESTLDNTNAPHL